MRRDRLVPQKRRALLRSRRTALASVVVAATLLGCGRDELPPEPGRDPEPAASSDREPHEGSESESADAARSGNEATAELERIIKNPESSHEARRAALVELARTRGAQDVLAGLTQPAEALPRIDIPLPSGPPREEPVDAGRYVLSYALDFDGGQAVSQRKACDLERDGERLRIRIERSHGEPMTGTLRNGVFQAQGREGDASIRLAGQVVAKGSVVGTVAGESAERGLRIREGRFRLDRVE